MKQLIILIILFTTFTSTAQIGYQVSLLNNATGEPRTNESVNVTVKITDSAGNVICEQTKHETTNDFGILSMSVGSSDTFADADWSKLPFFIEATIDGRLIGRSQLLSVPVAEHAKHTGTLTKEILCSKTWKRTIHYSDHNRTYSIQFGTNETFKFIDSDKYYNYSGTYEIEGNFVTLYYIKEESKVGKSYRYSHKKNALLDTGTDGWLFE